MNMNKNKYVQPFQLTRLEGFKKYWSSLEPANQLRDFIYKQGDAGFEKGNALRDNISTIEDIECRRKLVRKQFIESIGDLPKSDNPLNPQITGSIHDEGFRIEKIIFESRPNVYVTANMYIPDGITEPRGTVLFVCGHHEHAKHADEYQIVCRTLVKAGLVVFAQDPVGQGERKSYYEPSLGTTTVRWGTGEHDYVGVQCLPLGQSIARYFVHDAMRGIDYLLTRPEVDRNKIGITGNSGGGTQTTMMMICDQRLAAAAPGTFLMSANGWMHTGSGQDMEQIWPGLLATGFEHEDILLAMAPRPTLVLAATYDFFPIESTRDTIARGRKFWDIYGKNSNLELFEQVVRHEYTPEMAAKSAEFFSEHLLGKKVKVDNSKVMPIRTSQLFCTKSGQLRGEIEGALFVHEENKSNLLDILKKSKLEMEKQRNALIWLKERIFYNRKPCSQNLRVLYSGHYIDLCLDNVFWFSQENLVNHALVFRDYRFADAELPLTIAVWDHGTNRLGEHHDWIRRVCSSGRAVMILNATGIGATEPNPINSRTLHEWYGTICRFANDLVWFNDSFPALRAYDVTRAVDVINEIPNLNSDDIQLYGHGRQSVYALLAAAVDKRVKTVIEEKMINSYAEFISSRHYDEYDINSIGSSQKSVLRHNNYRLPIQL